MPMFVDIFLLLSISITLTVQHWFSRVSIYSKFVVSLSLFFSCNLLEANSSNHLSAYIFIPALLRIQPNVKTNEDEPTNYWGSWTPELLGFNNIFFHHSSAITPDFVIPNNSTSFKILIYMLWLFYHLLLSFQLNIQFQHCLELAENLCSLTYYLYLFWLSQVPNNSGCFFPYST